MTTFPALTPSSRTFTPGGYPHTALRAMSGFMGRVRNSNVMLGSQLRLTFVAITEAQMLTILSHYNTQRGGFDSFLLPADLWSGTSSAGDYQLTGYGWIYAEPPTVTDAMCADAYDVELSLASVPPEGTAQLGLDQVVTVAISGSAFAFNGAQLVVTASLNPGIAGPGGLASVVTASLDAGTPVAGSTTSGLNLLVTVGFEKGPDSFGLTQTVTATFTPGQTPDEFLDEWLAQNYSWQEGVFLDWWGT